LDCRLPPLLTFFFFFLQPLPKTSGPRALRDTFPPVKPISFCSQAFPFFFPPPHPSIWRCPRPGPAGPPSGPGPGFKPAPAPGANFRGTKTPRPVSVPEVAGGFFFSLSTGQERGEWGLHKTRQKNGAGPSPLNDHAAPSPFFPRRGSPLSASEAKARLPCGPQSCTGGSPPCPFFGPPPFFFVFFSRKMPPEGARH